MKKYSITSYIDFLTSLTGIPSNRIIIGGFGQGGTMALQSGLTFDYELAAIVALSCYIPMNRNLYAIMPVSISLNFKTPYF